MTDLHGNDLQFLRQAIAVAQRARDKGNHPFGAVVVDENGVVLFEGENTVNTEHDATGHAVKVVGPAMEDEARVVHVGFWQS